MTESPISDPELRYAVVQTQIMLVYIAGMIAIIAAILASNSYKIWLLIGVSLLFLILGNAANENGYCHTVVNATLGRVYGEITETKQDIKEQLE